MEARIDKERSSTRRSLKSLRNNSYSVLDEDPGSRTRSEIEDICTSNGNTNDIGIQFNTTPCQQVSITNEDKNIKQVVEDEEVRLPRKNKWKYRLMKKKREHVSTEFLVIEEDQDFNKEHPKNRPKKNKKKNKKKISKKYEKECSLTKEEKRTKKKKRTKRIKKAGIRAAKAVGDGFLQLGAAFRYMSPIAAMTDRNYNSRAHNTSYL